MSDLPFFNLRFARQVLGAAQKLAKRLRPKDPFAEVEGPLADATATPAEKRAFYEAGMDTCPRCKNAGIFSSFYGRNGRANGDGYGTERFSCSKCDLIVDFGYDEAGDEPYYHETAGWNHTEYVKRPMHRR